MVTTQMPKGLGIIFLMSFAVSTPCVNTQTSIMDTIEYRSFCASAAQIPTLFATFRSHPLYQDYLEHVYYDQAEECLRIIKQKTPHFLQCFDRFKRSDEFGNPWCYGYEGIGQMAPTTLRYIKIASDLETLFGSLDNLSIIEIGGGYGGQCKIVADLYNFKSYTIVDLAEPLALTQRFLSLCDVNNVTLVTPEQFVPDQHYDLIISNYAFSECSDEVQKKYVDDILSHATAGYLICNVLPQRSIKIHSEHEVLRMLDLVNIPYFLLPEEPLTGNGNYILAWNKKSE